MEAGRVRKQAGLIGWRHWMMWGLVLAVPLGLFGGSPPEASPILMLFSALALVAGLIAKGTSQRLTLPFVVVTWWAFGPLAAWLVDAAVFGALTVGALHRAHSNRPALGVQAFHLTLASVTASLLATATRSGIASADVASVVAPLVFALSYLTLDHLLRNVAEPATYRQSTLTWLLVPMLGVAGVVLVQAQVSGLVALLLGPLAALHLLEQASNRLDQAHEQTVQTLAAMLQRAHPYTHRHLERVAETAEQVALRLGLGRARAHEVRQAALLHDIGKIAIDEAILDAPRRLTADEFEHVKLHAPYGGEILSQIDSMRETARWIRYHHERPDGSGYPQGLSDPEIPLESKIIAVVDAFDAMTGGMEGKDGRPFRAPMTQSEALAELHRCAGSQFDPDVVAAFQVEVEGCLV